MGVLSGLKGLSEPSEWGVAVTESEDEMAAGEAHAH